MPVAPGGFELNGKMAVRNAAERYSARFIWRQSGRVFDIDVWGPLGQGRVHLRVTAGGSRCSTAMATSCGRGPRSR